LVQGVTIELNDIYIGSKKELKSRLIVTKLTEENKIKREFTHNDIIRILKRTIVNFKRLGIKSRKKHKKTVFDILQILKLNKPSNY
jgi:hypothetical protein